MCTPVGEQRAVIGVSFFAANIEGESMDLKHDGKICFIVHFSCAATSHQKFICVPQRAVNTHKFLKLLVNNDDEHGGTCQQHCVEFIIEKSETFHIILFGG